MIDLQKKFSNCFDNNILRKPIIIEKEGQYCISNDIIVDFNPIYPSYEDIELLPSLRYGFFGAILLVGENIEMDLRGHEIKMSNSFSLSQRFFSIFELNTSPFPFNDGLPIKMTKEQWKAGTKITIRNGRIGQSSHSSIHGNDNRQINLIKLTLYDFEVGGIMMNGCKHLFVCKCDIGPNFQNLLVNAKMSAATQLIHHFYNVLPQKTEKSKEFIELENLIEQTKMATTLENVPKLFQNPQKVIDGTVYGISLHKSGVAIGGHGNTSQKNHYGFHITLRNVSIHNLVGNVDEKISFVDKNKKVIRDISGQIIDLDLFLNEKEWNPLLEVQIQSIEWLKTFPDFISTLYIPQELINLYKNDFSTIEHYIQTELTPKFGRDVMIHINKGVIGLRLDGVNIVDIQKLYIENIQNISTDIVPNNSNLIQSNMEDNTKYVGNDTVSFCLNNVYNVKVNEIEINDIYSKSGSTFGILIMNDSQYVLLNQIIMELHKNLEQKNKTQYGIIVQDSSKNVNIRF